jgi:hypothetical protein
VWNLVGHWGKPPKLGRTPSQAKQASYLQTARFAVTAHPANLPTKIRRQPQPLHETPDLKSVDDALARILRLAVPIECRNYREATAQRPHRRPELDTPILLERCRSI